VKAAAAKESLALTCLAVKSNFRQRCSLLNRYIVDKMLHNAPPGLKSMKKRI